MPLFGKIVVIKRNGTDGTHFPLTVNSCTFGRKKECDIRIQLPQVSKEHCKIEINENEEAILINLSAVNPTQLNGSDFQQPIYLKHGDVLTIIDRSFRFEYPPAPLTRKKIARSEEKETLQVLHVQQVEQEELHPQNSEYEELECEGQKTNGSHERRTHDNTTSQNGTNEPTCKIHRSGRKSMSPFSTLYEFMKHKVETKLTEESFSDKIAIQQRVDCSPRKGSIDTVVSQTLHRISASGQTVQTKETETIALENFEESTSTENQGINLVVSHPMFVSENNSRRSPRVLQTCAANESQDSEETNLLHIQNVKENEHSEVIRRSHFDENRPSSGCSFTSCSIVELEYSEKASCYERSVNLSTETVNVEVKTNVNTSGSEESVLPRSKAGGESLETFSGPCSRRASDMLQTELDPLLGLKNTAEISTEIEGDIMPVTTREEEESGVLIGNKYLKTNGDNELLDTEQPLDAQNLEETKMESDGLQDGHFETIACLVHHSNSKSPRRSTRQRRKISNAGSMIMEDSLVTVRDVSPFKGAPEESKMKCWLQENDGNIEERPTIKSPENNFGVKNTAGSSYLSASCHKSLVRMPAEDVVQEMNMSNQCSIKKKPAVQKSPQKRKSGELDLSIQLLGKRKRVSFGGHLSPELFDKRLPPNSPLKRGAIPARFSLPFGNSPRAVLKKASGFKQCGTKGFSGKDQQETTLSRKRSPAASSPARRSPAASSPARRSPVASSPARRSPVASSPARRSPAASSPARRSPAASSPARRSPAASSPARRSPAASSPARRSPAASSPARRSPAASSPARRSPAASSPARRSPAASPCSLPQVRGRFSVSRVDVPSLSSVEQNVHEREMDVNKEVKTPEPSHQESKTVQSTRRSNKFAPKRTSLHRRSGAMDAIRAKRQSGASEANLIVSRSWADIVKQGVPKSQQRTTSKCGLKRPAKKILTKAPKTNVSSLKTPTRKVKGYFTTGHANSPAPIVVGKAHSSIVKTTVQVPKVMFNYSLKKQQDPNESFTGMTEMFHTPPNWQQGSSLSSVQTSNMSTPEEASEICTPEESGEMTVSPLHLPIQQIYDNQNIESPILMKVSQISTVDQHELKVPRGGNSTLDKVAGGNSSLVTSETVGMEEITKYPTEKSDCIEAHSGTKRIMRTPKEKPELVKTLSGVTGMLGTPKQEPEMVEALSEVKRLFRTPKEKPEPVEALSGVKRLLRTPKKKPKPVEALSGVKRLLRTPKEKPEPVEALSGVKRLLRTPKEKPEPVEALSGVKRLLRTPKQKPEPVEALSGVKRLLRTPIEKPEPVEALSGVKRLLRTPNHKEEPVKDDICSTLLNSPEGLFGLNHVTKEQMEKMGVVENVEEIQRQLRTPKQKIGPVEDMIGISRIPKTPRQKFMPVDDYLGLQKLMAEPKQNSLSAEIDYTGVQELLGPVDGYLVNLSESVNELQENSSSEFGCKGHVPEREESWQQGGLEDSFGKKSPNAMPRRPDDGHDQLQDSLGPASCSSHNDVTGAHAESIETVQFVQEQYKSDGLDFQSGTIINIIEESFARQGDSMERNAEIPESLASAKKPREGKVAESSFTEKQDTTKAPRQTRNSSRARLASCKQTNENFDQNTPEASPAKESESSSPALETETSERLREKSRKHSIETNRSMDLDNIRHTQELLGLSKEKSIKTQVSVNRKRVAAKLNRQAEESLHLEENAANQEYQKNKDEPKSEFTKTNSQEKMQSPNLETIKRNSGNQLRKKNTRKRKAAPVEMETVDGEKHISPKICKLETLENHPTEVKEGAEKRKRRKVHFLLEKNTSETLEEKCVFGGKGGTQQEQYNAFFERLTPAVQENTEKNTRKAASVVSPSLCIPFSSEKPALAEISKDREENFTLTNENQASFAQGECLQKINCDKYANETQMVPSENMQISVEHSAPKKQKVAVAKKNPPRRGRSRAASQEPSTENGSKVTPETEKQPTSVEDAISSKENQSKRGRGRKVAPVSRTLGTLTIPNLDTSTGSSGFAPGDLQDTQNEKNSDEVQKVCLDSIQATTEHILPKRQKVARGNRLPQNGRSKQAISHEPAAENNNKEHPDVENQDMVSEDAFTAKENPPRRGRRKKVVNPVSQTLGTVTVPKEDPLTGSCGFAQVDLQDAQNEENSNEVQKVGLDNSRATAEHILLKRQKIARGNRLPQNGRSRQVVSHEPAAEDDNKEHPDVENQDMVVEDAFSAKENQPKRGRGRRVAPVSQTLGTPIIPKKDPSTGCSGFAQGDLQNEKNSNEVQKVCLDNIQATAEHILPKRQKVERRNRLPQQEVSHEPAAEKDNKKHPDVENQDMVVEDAFNAKENQPKRGRRRKVAPVSQTHENLTVPEEGASTGRPSFAQEKCLRDTQDEALDNIESSVEHILPERQKVARGNLPRRGRNKQVVSHEPPTENNDAENQDKVVKNAFTVEENLPKKGRGRKVAAVPQILESDSFPLSSKDKNAAEEQDEALEMVTTANKNPSRRGRSRKTLVTSSVPASKKPRVVDNVNQDETASVLKDMTKENVSKRGRTKPPAYEASTEMNSQRRAPGGKPTPVKGKKVPADSVLENQSKRSRGKNIVLAFQAPSSPALKISITLPSSPSDKNETASENQNLLIENNVTGKENLAGNGRRNKKVVPCSKSVRRKCKLPEEEGECQEKQSANKEKIGVSNGKQSRRAVRKVDASETTFLKEKYGLPESSDGILKDQQVIMINPAEDASQGRSRRVLKGKNLPKHSDQKNNNQKNDLEITLPQGKENASKRGRRKQVSTEPEMHGTVTGMKKSFFAGNIAAAPEAENTGKALQRGRRKKTEEHTSATTEYAVETRTKMKASRTTKKVL